MTAPQAGRECSNNKPGSEHAASCGRAASCGKKMQEHARRAPDEQPMGTDSRQVTKSSTAVHVRALRAHLTSAPMGCTMQAVPEPNTSSSRPSWLACG